MFSKTNETSETMMLFEKAAEYGVNSLTHPEILAALIGLKPDQAAEVLEITGGIEGIARNEMWDMLLIPHLGKSRTLRLAAAVEFAVRLQQAKMGDRPVIEKPEDAANLLMARLRHLDREHFMVILLNTKNHVLGVETVSIGSLNSTVVHPRELFKQAIRRSAAAVILAHNHPSGDPHPSTEDEATTKRLVEAGKLLGIEVLDHIIIGHNTYRSLKRMGVI